MLPHRIRSLFALVTTLTVSAVLIVSGTAYAQNADRIATVRGSDIVILTDGEVQQTFPIPDFVSIGSLIASPDGGFLAYIGYREDGSSLQLLDVEDGSVLSIAENTAAGYPVSFTDTGELVYAIQGASVGTSETGGLITALDVYTYSPENGSSTILTSLRTGTGCGGGSPLPTDMQYTSETGGLGGQSLVLAVTPFGILYSPDCSGVSVALMRLNEQREEVFMDLAHTALSPDRTQVAGIIMPMGAPIPLEITLVDLETGTMRNLPVNSTPDRLAWASDGSAVYYSTQAFDTEVTLEGERGERFAEFNGSPSFIRFGAALSRVDVFTGEVTDLFSQSAFAVGRILPVGQVVYVSTIANLDAWADAVADNTIDLIAATNEESMAYTPVTLWRIDPQTGEADVAAENAQQAVSLP